MTYTSKEAARKLAAIVNHEFAGNALFYDCDAARISFDDIRALLAERDSYRAVLAAAGYGDIDDIGRSAIEKSQALGMEVARRTIELMAERDELLAKTQWHGIDSAPKDGTPVTVLADCAGFPGNFARVNAAFHQGVWRIYGPILGEPNCNGRERQWLGEVRPTIWQHLSPTE